MASPCLYREASQRVHAHLIADDASVPHPHIERRDVLPVPVAFRVIGRHVMRVAHPHRHWFLSIPFRRQLDDCRQKPVTNLQRLHACIVLMGVCDSALVIRILAERHLVLVRIEDQSSRHFQALVTQYVMGSGDMSMEEACRAQDAWDSATPSIAN